MGWPLIHPIPNPIIDASGSARQRAIITPLPWKPTDPDMITYASSHPYVRRYWTATIGPGAVADLLRYALNRRSFGNAGAEALQPQPEEYAASASPGS